MGVAGVDYAVLACIFREHRLSPSIFNPHKFGLPARAP